MTNIPKLQHDNIIFVLIDLQTKLLSKIQRANRIVNSNILLLEVAKALDCLVIATTQYRQGLGNLVDQIAPLVGEDTIDKMTFSCVAAPAFQQRLKSSGRKWVVVSGIETHICVLQTSLDLLREGYQVAIVTDAIGARAEEDHLRGLQRLERSGALLVTTEMLIYELLGQSDTESFKKVLPLIKARPSN
jgi:nicotinamidase-related amidase